MTNVDYMKINKLVKKLEELGLEMEHVKISSIKEIFKKHGSYGFFYKQEEKKYYFVYQDYPFPGELEWDSIYLDIRKNKSLDDLIEDVLQYYTI